MDTLKKFFSFSFGSKDVAALVIKIIIYVVAGAVIGFLLGVIGKLPLVGIITGLLGTLVGIYTTAGIVIAILDYCKVFK